MLLSRDWQRSRHLQQETPKAHWLHWGLSSRIRLTTLTLPTTVANSPAPTAKQPNSHLLIAGGATNYRLLVQGSLRPLLFARALLLIEDDSDAEKDQQD